ncbi:MAG: MFS transporter, partial [Gammaproteobacteria bacterium]
SDLLFMVAAMLFALCLVPVALTRAAHPRPVEPIQFDVMHLIRQAPFGLLGCLGAGLVNGAFYGLAAVYSRRLGLDVAGVSLFMGTTILSGLVLQWPVGHLSDRYDRRSVLALLSIGVSLVSLLIMLSGVGLVALLLGAAVFGGLAFTIYPVSVAHANDHIEADEVVPATATLILAYSIGASLGPLGGAVAMWRAGPSGLWVFTASVSLVLGLLVYLRRGADTVTVEEQGEFVAMPRTSAVIAELDPRAEPAIEGAAAAAGEADPAATPEAGDPSGRSAP